MDRIFLVVLVILGGGLIVLLVADSSGTMSDAETSRFGSLVYLGALATVIAAGLLASRQRFGDMARTLAIWVVIVLALMAGYEYRYELQDDDRLVLDRHAAWMKEHAGTLMLVEGHCDERGTGEYNISLGERRAKATANYLTSQGVASDRITIISYGEQQPVCRDATEGCWQKNRRAHFLVKPR